MRQTFIVYDSAVAEYAAVVGEGAVNVCGAVALDATEQNKNIETVLGICRYLMEAGATRNDLVIAVGGGVTSDIVGFAASI